jgi:hypothetical protein
MHLADLVGYAVRGKRAGARRAAILDLEGCQRGCLQVIGHPVCFNKQRPSIV